MNACFSKLGAAAVLGVGICSLALSTPARAIDFKAGDWNFTVSGEINVHYIYSSCQNASSAVAIVTVGGACTGSDNGSNVSHVSNGLLPAALNFGVSTVQNGIDIAGHFGFYPGISTNDGGSPNLQQGAPAGSNVALGTTGLDVRQVFMTFGNKNIGTFTLGRNFGLFGFDAIINDMTIPGVGVAGSASTASPSNTSLGSIGFGYIYTDTLAQINYTTPDFAGLNLTLGIFDPLNSLTAAGTNEPKGTPGFHGKATYTVKFNPDMKLYVSSSFIDQKQRYEVTTTGPGAATTQYGYNSFGFDVTSKFDWAAFEALVSYYHGSGLGTTGLFVLSDDGLGHKRSSDGYLLQATYALGPVKLGVNYGVSQLDYANDADRAAVPNLLRRNSKVTGGAYYSLTKNLTLLSEVSQVETKAHSGGSNDSTNFNIGAYLAF